MWQYTNKLENQAASILRVNEIVLSYQIITCCHKPEDHNLNFHICIIHIYRIKNIENNYKAKLKLCLCLIKHHATFLSALDVGDWSAS